MDQCVLAHNSSDDVTEDLLQQHHQLIVQWLDDLLQDNISVIILLSLRHCL